MPGGIPTIAAIPALAALPAMGRRGWMWLALTLALVIGASAGVIADRLALENRLRARHQSGSSGFLWFSCDEQDVEHSPAYPYQARHRQVLVKRLSKRLELDTEQVQALEALLEEKREGAHAYWSGVRDSYCSMQTSFRSDIRDLLRPDQAATWDELVRRIDARHEERLREQREDDTPP